MYTRWRATAAVFAMLLALVSPTAGHHGGTTGARVSAVAHDSVPAVRHASRDHLEAAPLLDATATSSLADGALQDARPNSRLAPLPAYRLRGPARVRGPPPD